MDLKHANSQKKVVDKQTDGHTDHSTPAMHTCTQDNYNWSGFSHMNPSSFGILCWECELDLIDLCKVRALLVLLYSKPDILDVFCIHS